MAGWKEYAHEIRKRETPYSVATDQHVAMYALDDNRVYIIDQNGGYTDFQIKDGFFNNVQVSGNCAIVGNEVVTDTIINGYDLIFKFDVTEVEGNMLNANPSGADWRMDIQSISGVDNGFNQLRIFDNVTGNVSVSLRKGGNVIFGTDAAEANDDGHTVQIYGSHLVTGTTDLNDTVVIGVDPSGTEILRVGGDTKSSGYINSSIGYFGEPVSPSSKDVNIGYAGGYYDIQAVHNGTAYTTLSLSRYGGAVTIGTDPGGSELLRVGGDIRTTQAVFGTGAAFVAGSIYANTAVGLVVGSRTGSAYDFYLSDPAGNAIAVVPTGTRNVVIGTDPGGTELLRVGGGITIPSGNKIAGAWSTSDVRMLLQPSYFGYSSDYKVLRICPGSVGQGNAVTIALGVDPITNTGSTFVGDGREILFRRDMVFMQPNSENTNWERASITMGSLILGTDPGGSELLRVGGGARLADTLFVTNGTVQTIMSYGSTYGTIGTNSAHSLYLITNGAQRVNIDGSGNVVIGTDPGGSELLRSPSIRVGTGGIVGAGNDSRFIASRNAANNATLDLMYLDANDHIQFGNTVLKTSGNLVLGTTTYTAGNGAIQLATHTTKAGGIAVGPDAWIHREASYQTTLAQTADANGAIIAFRDVTNSVFRGLIGYGAYLFNSGSITDFGITSYGALKLGSNGGTTGLTIDTSQNTTLAGNLSQTGGKYFYLRGDASTDGSVRISSQASATATIEKRVSGSWTTITTWS